MSNPPGESLRRGLPEDAPLAAVWRGDRIESVHRGRAMVRASDGETLESVGDPEGYVYLRSSAKPFQALPLVLSGTAEDYRLTGREIAVACASHNGEAGHLAAVRSILRKAGLSEDDLRNGVHPPFHGASAARLARNGEEPRAIHGNCSGKHAGMLAVCAHEGWETESYRDPEHPLQRKVLEVIARVCDVSRARIVFTGDNCGVPTFALPLENAALGFARLASGEGLNGELAEAAGVIRDAMREDPYMVAGTDRFDTELMRETDLVAKSGAEAVFACGSPEGWGMALKVSDGSTRAVRRVASALLVRHGVELPERLISSGLHDLHGEKVGEISPLI